MDLLGKVAIVTDIRSEHYAAEGIVRGFNGVEYLLQVDGKRKVFRRNQFYVPGKG